MRERGGRSSNGRTLTLPVWAPLRPMEMVTALSLVWMARETPARRRGVGPVAPDICENSLPSPLPGVADMQNDIMGTAKKKVCGKARRGPRGIRSFLAEPGPG